MKQTWYFTFGQQHALKDNWVEVHNATREESRAEMFERYGTKWSMQYTENDFDKSFFPNGCAQVIIL